MMRLVLLAFVSCLPNAASLSCLPNATHGCLNGNPYEYSSQFTCGSMVDGVQAIYEWSTSGCCAQGLAFDSGSEYCCFDGVHTYSEGECIEYNAKKWNTDCFCDGDSEAAAASEATSSGGDDDGVPDQIDTSVTPEDPCSTADEQYGCLNGFQFNYTLQYPCSSYILRYDTMGCCQASPYNLETESCCKLGDDYSVSGSHACDCSKYGCQ